MEPYWDHTSQMHSKGPSLMVIEVVLATIAALALARWIAPRVRQLMNY